MTIIYFMIYLVFLIIYFIKGISELNKDLTNNVVEKSKKNDFNKIISINILKEKIEAKNIQNNRQKDINSREYMKNNEKIDNRYIRKNINSKYKKNIQYKYYNKSNNMIYINRKKKKKFQPIIFNYPPKKSFPQLEKYEIDSKNKINVSKSKIDNNILMANKKGTNNEVINKQVLDLLKFDKNQNEKLDIYELNNLEYDSAKKLDKRNFLETYWSFLRREHLIIY